MQVHRRRIAGRVGRHRTNRDAQPRLSSLAKGPPKGVLSIQGADMRQKSHRRIERCLGPSDGLRQALARSQHGTVRRNDGRFSKEKSGPFCVIKYATGHLGDRDPGGFRCGGRGRKIGIDQQPSHLVGEEL